MAAHARYPSAHQQLGELMVDARRRGVPFERMWEAALRPGKAPITPRVPESERPAGCIVWPTDTNDRRSSMSALTGTKEAWRRSFERAPQTRAEAQLASLAAGLSALESVAEERADAELIAS